MNWVKKIFGKLRLFIKPKGKATMDAKLGLSCPTRTLDDQPVTNDEFGSHAPIAQAIFEMVRTETGGKAIALEGVWGSGKSTVIKILQRLSHDNSSPNSSEIGVFVFDAWAHQGDPMRRSFLERFNAFLVEMKWAEPGQWEDTLDEITGRKTTKEVTTKVRLRCAGRIVVAFGLLWMLVNALISSNEINEIPLSIRLGTLVVLSILVLGFVVLDKFINILGMLFEAPRTVEEIERRRIPDRSSVEFAEIFTQMVTHALEKDSRRLVVVIDNLDRLDPQESLSIWATMKSFFQQRTSVETSIPWASRFWLIVPYDPKAIKRLWNKTNEEKNFSTAFLDKTFQIRFRVPTPVLEDWYTYLHRQLQTAFPNHNRGELKQELEKVCRIYRRYRLSTNAQPVTPRDLKLFVNNLGALHRQWQDEIPLSMQSLYILFREKIERNPRKFLTTQDSIPKPVRLLLEESMGEMRWAQYLGALHFNVSPDKVMHLLINEDIEKALVEGQGEALLDLHGYPGFWTVLASVIEDRTTEWAQTQPGYLGTAAAALAQLEVNISHKNNLWGLLRTAIREVKGHWSPLGRTVAQGLCAILEHTPGEDAEQTAKQIIAAFSRTPPPEDEDKGDLWQDWYQGMLTFVREAQRLGLGKILRSSFRISGPIQAYLQVMARLSQEEDGVALAPYFLLADPNLDVAQEIATLCKGGNFSAEHLKAVELMINAKIEYAWQEAVIAAKERLRSNPNLQSSEVNHLLWLLLDVFDHKPREVESFLVDLARGRIFHHLHRAKSEGSYETVALCTTILLEHNPKGDLSDNWQYAVNGQNIYRRLLSSPTIKDIEAIARVYSKRGRITPLLALPERNSNVRPLVGRVVEHLANHHRGIFSAELLVDEYGWLERLLPEEVLQSLIEEKRESVINEVVQRPFDINKAALYYTVLVTSSKKPPLEFLIFLRGGLQEVERETWEEQLDKRGYLAKILLAYPRRRKVGLGHKLGDAIERYARKLLEEENQGQFSVEEMGRLLNALDRDSRLTTLRRIRGLLIRNSKVELTSVLNVFGPHLYKVLGEERTADEVVRVLFCNIVEGKVEEELRWIATAIAKNPLILHNAFLESIKDLENRVLEALKDEGLTTPIKDLYQEILSHLERALTSQGKQKE